MKLRDVLLISDLDGTLIGRDHTVPQRNVEAVRRFQQKGGHFSIATGRSVDSGARYFSAAVPNELCVLLNGSVIYDFEAKKVTKAFFLPEEAKAYVRKISDRFPQAGIEIFTREGLFVLRQNEYVRTHLDYEHLPCVESRMADIGNEGWCKVLCAADPAVKEEMHAFTDTFPHEGVRFVETSEFFLEMLPVHVDKGTGLLEVIRQTRFCRENVYAIGDYYNDVEMLREAGFAAVPDNAPDDIKALADLVVGHCHDGAVADLIEYLEKIAEE